ncbi:MAG: hypothetical protein Q7R81_07560 [Candidatus Peregrinibacteria bacterium]|nr:hypothetical protein [Candidatus Peregrinibacteria bacterium]
MICIPSTAIRSFSARKSARGKWLGNELRRAGVVQGKAELRSVGGKKSKGYRLNQAHITRLLSAYGGVVTGAEATASGKEDGVVTAE